jgi:hypothetical protein
VTRDLRPLLCSKEADHAEHLRLDGRMCPGKGYRWGWMDRPKDMPPD